MPMKKLGHAIEDYVADQSPMGNSSIIDGTSFEWVERLERCFRRMLTEAGLLAPAATAA